ncbi:hypothetical protein Ssi02_39950 [Sinosporangium siamense]|uniref:Uncharacterized protein n=1 Tax=Sinosporangium siamense TaxID=1367973 RepID=A0A919RK04_9ACTN|nr:hypothetical protein Ssi02_39950 [Sinosporangium siamense]
MKHPHRCGADTDPPRIANEIAGTLSYVRGATRHVADAVDHLGTIPTWGGQLIEDDEPVLTRLAPTRAGSRRFCRP